MTPITDHGSRITFLSAAALALLTACASTPVDSDGALRVKWIRTSTAWRDCAQANGTRLDPATQGCYTWRAGVCHVYAPDPPLNDLRQYRSDQWATLGHELKHCFDGNFHAPYDALVK